MQYSFRVLDHDKNFSLLLYELLVQPRLQGLSDNKRTVNKKMLISVLVFMLFYSICLLNVGVFIKPFHLVPLFLDLVHPTSQLPLF